MRRAAAGAAAGGSLTESFSLSYLTSVAATSPGTTTDYGTLSLGVDVSGDDKRYTVVCVTGILGGPPTTASLTVAATSASAASDGVTDAIKIQSSKGGAWIFIVDTSGLGTTGNITATFDAAPSESGLSVFRLINPSSITATDVATATHASGVVTLDATISTGGAAVACTQSQNGGSATWAGLTERTDSDLATNEWFSSASGGASGSPTSISMTSSDTSPSALFGVCASFAPHPSAP